MSLNRNNLDQIYGDFRVYVEGVQIPFISASVTNTYNAVPTAYIEVVAFPGLDEIGRNYHPKVQIYYRDFNYGVSQIEATRLKDATARRDAIKDSYKLVFSGVITATQISKNIGVDTGSQTITLQCAHNYVHIDEVMIRYSGQALQANIAEIDVAQGQANVASLNKKTAAVQALAGVSDTREADDPIHHVPAGKFNELKGTPGVIKVLWNMIKYDAKRNIMSQDSEAITDLYVPLIEDGLRFWENMTGHPLIEEGIEGAKVARTVKDTNEGSLDEQTAVDVQIPAKFRTFIGEAAQIELSIGALDGVIRGMGSPEVSSFGSHLLEMLELLDYDATILSSPISKADGSMRDHILKPKLPYYYAPICNVLLPNLITTVNITNNYATAPTRTINMAKEVNGVNSISTVGMDLSYTSPHSVRKARSPDGLIGSIRAVNNKVGKYEWGQGIRPMVSRLPQAYDLLSAALARKNDETPDDKIVGADIQAKAAAAWDKMYPGDAAFNPYAAAAGVLPFQRLNFLYADHQFAMENAKVRSGQVQGVFNPYAVVGYPMDVVDQVPSSNSYHGMCTSITHSFSADGMATTDYGLIGMSTFAELALHNLPATNPYLMGALDFEDDPRIYGNPKAYRKACQVYGEVFGVGAAEPAILQDYTTGTMMPLFRDESTGGCWATGGDNINQETVRGSLMLVSRNITSLLEMEKLEGVSTIDIDDWISSQEGEVTYVPNPTRTTGISAKDAKINTPGIDAESSPFLEY